MWSVESWSGVRSIHFFQLQLSYAVKFIAMKCNNVSLLPLYASNSNQSLLKPHYACDDNIIHNYSLAWSVLLIVADEHCIARAWRRSCLNKRNIRILNSFFWISSTANVIYVISDYGRRWCQTSLAKSASFLMLGIFDVLKRILMELPYKLPQRSFRID